MFTCYRSAEDPPEPSGHHEVSEAVSVELGVRDEAQHLGDGRTGGGEEEPGDARARQDPDGAGEHREQHQRQTCEGNKKSGDLMHIIPTGYKDPYLTRGTKRAALVPSLRKTNRRTDGLMHVVTIGYYNRYTIWWRGVQPIHLAGNCIHPTPNCVAVVSYHVTF